MTGNDIYDWLTGEYCDDEETVAYILSEKDSLARFPEIVRWQHAAQLQSDLWNW